MTYNTKGIARVRAGFNPLGLELVKDLKFKTAELIDMVETIHEFYGEDDGHLTMYEKDQKKLIIKELERIKILAQTRFEEACMWAVKAATYSFPKIEIKKENKDKIK